VGGVLAELVAFDRCDAWRGRIDLAHAAARAELEPGALACVPDVLADLQQHKAALFALADLLVDRRKLSRRECIDVVLRAGVRVPPARFAPTLPVSEGLRLQRVTEEIAERRARVERLKKAARP